MATKTYRHNESSAPFATHLGFDMKMEARLPDLSAYVKAWSSGQYTYVDSRYISDWLARIGVRWQEGSLETFEEEDGTTCFAWLPDQEHPYQKVSFEDAWVEE